MRHLKSEDYVWSRWKNGGGETAEIAVFPPKAGLDDFIWRISMARVVSDGPFSIFLDVDRTLTIVRGDGLRLELGGKTHTLAVARPFSFSGDDPAEANLMAGPIVDFNMMTRRSAASHSVTLVVPGIVPVMAGQPAGLFALAETRIAAGTENLVLQARDSLLLDTQVTLEYGHALLWTVTLRG